MVEGARLESVYTVPRIVGSNPTYSARIFLMQPSSFEIETRELVLARILDAIRSGTTIKLPVFDPDYSVAGQVAFQTIGVEPNPYGGTLGPLRYQFEGEEDLLHLIVSRLDLGPISIEEGQLVCQWLFPEVPVALIWFKPGTVTQHFYLGHDILL